MARDPNRSDPLKPDARILRRAGAWLVVDRELRISVSQAAQSLLTSFTKPTFLLQWDTGSLELVNRGDRMTGSTAKGEEVWFTVNRLPFWRDRYSDPVGRVGIGGQVFQWKRFGDDQRVIVSTLQNVEVLEARRPWKDADSNVLWLIEWKVHLVEHELERVSLLAAPWVVTSIRVSDPHS